MRRVISLIVACILTTSLAACDGANKTAYAPVEPSEVSSSNYQDMVTQFKGAGFTNVSTKEIDDLILGWLTEDGQVKEVSIGGKTSFSTSDSFATDTPVVVSYHTSPRRRRAPRRRLFPISPRPPQPLRDQGLQPTPNPLRLRR